MDQTVRTLAEDQSRLAGIPYEVVEETLDVGEKGIKELHAQQSYKEHQEREIERKEEKAEREAEKAEREAGYESLVRSSRATPKQNLQNRPASSSAPSSSNQDKYEQLAQHIESDNPVRQDREIAQALIEADLDDATIEAILSESPEFRELSQIQGEDKARQYLDLIVDDAKRQDFLNQLENQNEIQTVEVLDREEEL